MVKMEGETDEAFAERKQKAKEEYAAQMAEQRAAKEKEAKMNMKEEEVADETPNTEASGLVVRKATTWERMGASLEGNPLLSSFYDTI